jgi:hypothetical protein
MKLGLSTKVARKGVGRLDPQALSCNPKPLEPIGTCGSPQLTSVGSLWLSLLSLSFSPSLFLALSLSFSKDSTLWFYKRFSRASLSTVSRSYAKYD